MSEQLNRVESLIRLKLTPAEYAAYQNTKSQTPSSPALNPALEAAEEFYRIVQRRSHVFLMEASRKVPASTAPRILVVGGFHTAAMADLLRRAHWSYVVLSPVVSVVSNEELSDEKRMRKMVNVLAQAITPEK